MSTSQSSRERLLAFYDGASRWMAPAVERFSDEPETVIASARSRFEALLPELPYVEQPGHSMAASMFSCAAMLAVFQVLREGGVDAHAFGRAIHTLPVAVSEGGPDAEAQKARDAYASQTDAQPNEFVFELLDGDENGDPGMDITSCAICHLFGRHDAMELVPYMCAFDDVMSDTRGEGLRRSGSIALGATHCDFRFRPGEPRRLAAEYPEQIRLGED